MTVQPWIHTWHPHPQVTPPHPCQLRPEAVPGVLSLAVCKAAGSNRKISTSYSHCFPPHWSFMEESLPPLPPTLSDAAWLPCCRTNLSGSQHLAEDPPDSTGSAGAPGIVLGQHRGWMGTKVISYPGQLSSGRERDFPTTVTTTSHRASHTGI